MRWEVKQLKSSCRKYDVDLIFGDWSGCEERIKFEERVGTRGIGCGRWAEQQEIERNAKI